MFELGPMQSLAAAGLTLALGIFLKSKIQLAQKYNLPAAVLGGLAVTSVLALLAKEGVPFVKFDKTFEPPLMIAFFTTLGFGASVKSLKAGNKAVVIFLAICTVFMIFQNLIGMIIAKSFGLHPLFGVLAGSVALAGGPGTAMAFAPQFETVGVHDASLVAITAAFCGILIGGITGTPIGTILIEKFKLAPAKKNNESSIELDDKEQVNDTGIFSLEHFESQMLKHGIILLAIMWIGSSLSLWIKEMGITLPGYIGAMIIAAIVRNIEDRFQILKINDGLMDSLGSIALTVFLCSALISLELWKLVNLALPLTVILLAQTLFSLSSAATYIFWTSGKDYDAAVTSAGFVGFMMGTTANAMANMKSLTAKYGPAPRAFLVVPIVGACFIDFVNAAMIGFLLQL